MTVWCSKMALGLELVIKVALRMELAELEGLVKNGLKNMPILESIVQHLYLGC